MYASYKIHGFSHRGSYNSCWTSSKQDTQICNNCTCKVETHTCIIYFAHLWRNLYTYTPYACIYVHVTIMYNVCTVIFSAQSSHLTVIMAFLWVISKHKNGRNKFSWEKLIICKYYSSTCPCIVKWCTFMHISIVIVYNLIYFEV